MFVCAKQLDCSGRMALHRGRPYPHGSSWRQKPPMRYYNPRGVFFRMDCFVESSRLSFWQGIVQELIRLQEGDHTVSAGLCYQLVPLALI